MLGLVALVILIGSASIYRYFKRQHEQHLTEFITQQHAKDGIKSDKIPRLKQWLIKITARMLRLINI